MENFLLILRATVPDTLTAWISREIHDPEYV